MKIKEVRGFLFAIVVSMILQGCLYSKVQRPLDTDFENTTLGTKIGVSDATSILWLFAWGDAGTKAAADNGGITTIKHADAKSTIILFGLYVHVETVVYGD